MTTRSIRLTIAALGGQGGGVLLWLFTRWEIRRDERGEEPLITRGLLKVPQLKTGLRMFLFQYFIQSGVFFVVPLFLSVSLGLSAIDTGVRLLPPPTAIWRRSCMSADADLLARPSRCHSPRSLS